MKSLRNYAYAAALVLSVWSLAPSLAAAQDATGKFTLTHDVQWQNASIPAGEYHFSIEDRGPGQMLYLQKISGEGAGYMVLSTETDPISESSQSCLRLVSKFGKKYVSAMELPQLGITLRFVVPKGDEKQAVGHAVLAAATGR